MREERRFKSFQLLLHETMMNLMTLLLRCGMILARFTTITGTCNLLQHSVPLERQLEFMTLKMGK